jgi:hypothetical protein
MLQRHSRDSARHGFVVLAVKRVVEPESYDASAAEILNIRIYLVSS